MLHGRGQPPREDNGAMNAKPNSELRPLLMFLALWFVTGALTHPVFAQRMPAASHGPSVASQSPMLGKPGDYVGWETCAGCHRAEAQSFMKTVHAPAGEGLPVSPAVPPAELSPSAAAGKKIYDDMMCAGCHKIGGQGGEGGPALENVGARLTRAGGDEANAGAPGRHGHAALAA